MNGNEDKIKSLYDILQKDTLYANNLPDFKTFAKKLKSDDKIKELHDILKADKNFGDLIEDYPKFYEKIKKKETPEGTISLPTKSILDSEYQETTPSVSLEEIEGTPIPDEQELLSQIPTVQDETNRVVREAVLLQAAGDIKTKSPFLPPGKEAVLRQAQELSEQNQQTLSQDYPGGVTIPQQTTYADLLKEAAPGFIGQLIEGTEKMIGPIAGSGANFLNQIGGTIDAVADMMQAIGIPVYNKEFYGSEVYKEMEERGMVDVETKRPKNVFTRVAEHYEANADQMDKFEGSPWEDALNATLGMTVDFPLTLLMTPTKIAGTIIPKLPIALSWMQGAKTYSETGDPEQSLSAAATGFSDGTILSMLGLMGGALTQLETNAIVRQIGQAGFMALGFAQKTQVQTGDIGEARIAAAMAGLLSLEHSSQLAGGLYTRPVKEAVRVEQANFKANKIKTERKSLVENLEKDKAPEEKVVIEKELQVIDNFIMAKAENEIIKNHFQDVIENIDRSNLPEAQKAAFRKNVMDKASMLNKHKEETIVKEQDIEKLQKQKQVVEGLDVPDKIQQQKVIDEKIVKKEQEIKDVVEPKPKVKEEKVPEKPIEKPEPTKEVKAEKEIKKEEKPPVEKPIKPKEDAKEIREDKEVSDEKREKPEAGKDDGRKDIQQPEKPRIEAGKPKKAPISKISKEQGKKDAEIKKDVLGKLEQAEDIILSKETKDELAEMEKEGLDKKQIDEHRKISLAVDWEILTKEQQQKLEEIGIRFDPESKMVRFDLGEKGEANIAIDNIPEIRKQFKRITTIGTKRPSKLQRKPKRTVVYDAKEIDSRIQMMEENIKQAKGNPALEKVFREELTNLKLDKSKVVPEQTKEITDEQTTRDTDIIANEAKSIKDKSKDAKSEEQKREVIEDIDELVDEIDRKVYPEAKPKDITPEEHLKEAKEITDLQEKLAEGKVKKDKAFDERMEELRTEERSKKADDKIAGGFEKLADIAKARKKIIGDENPLGVKDVYDAIRDIIEGYVMKGHLSVDQIIKKIKDKISEYGITVENVDEYKDELTELINEQRKRRKVLGDVTKLKERISDLKQEQKDIGVQIREITGHIKRNRTFFTGADYTKLLNIVRDLAVRPKKRAGKGEVMTRPPFSEKLKEAFDIIEKAEVIYGEKLEAERLAKEVEKEVVEVDKTIANIEKSIGGYKPVVKLGQKIGPLPGYVKGAKGMIEQYKTSKEREKSLEQDWITYDESPEIAKINAKATAENEFLDYIDRQRELIEEAKDSDNSIEVRQAAYEEIALKDMMNMFNMDSKDLKNVLGNIKRTIKEGKSIEAEERAERAEEHRKWREENIETVKQAVGKEYFKPTRAKEKAAVNMKALAGIVNTRAWLGYMGVKLGVRKERILYSDPLNNVFYEGKDGIMEAENKHETLKRESKKENEALIKPMGKNKIARNKWDAKQHERNDTGAFVEYANGTKEELRWTKNEIMGVLIMERDPSTHVSYYHPITKLKNGTTIGMGWTKKTKEALEKYVGPENVKLIDKIQEKIPYWGGQANKVYIDLNGVSMMVNENFVMTARKGMAKEDVAVKADKFLKPSASGGHLKQRKGVIGTYDYIDIFELYNNYKNDMIDYASYAKTFKKWSSVFGNPSVRSGMVKRYGSNFTDQWKFYLNNMVGKAGIQIGGPLDRSIRTFQKGAIYFNPMPTLKQLVSTTYLMNYIPTNKFFQFSKDIPTIVAEVVLNKALKGLKTVNTELYNLLSNTSLVKSRKESRSVWLDADFQIDQKGLKVILKDNTMLDTYRKIKQGKISPYSNRVKELNNLLGGSLIGIADRMPITIGGSAYVKIQYERLSGRKLTMKDIQNAKDGKPNKYFKQTMIDWESIAEATQQSIRKSNQAYFRVSNQLMRGLVMFTSAQHQIMLAGHYHRRAGANDMKAGRVTSGLKHFAAWSTLTVLSSSIFSYLNNGFRINEDELTWDVAIGMTASGIPGFHQAMQAIKAGALDKPWGEHFDMNPVVGVMDDLRMNSQKALESADDVTVSEEYKKSLYLKIGTSILQLQGFNAPKLVRLYKNWSTIGDSDFPFQAALGINVDYLEGQKLLDVLKDFDDMSFPGETRDEFNDRLEYINSQRGKKLRIDLDDPKTILNYRAIYKASQAGDTWAINYIKKFDVTIYSRPDRYIKNEDKVKYLDHLAKDMGTTINKLYLTLIKHGYQFSEGMSEEFLILKLRERGGLSKSEMEEKIKEIRNRKED